MARGFKLGMAGLVAAAVLGGVPMFGAAPAFAKGSGTMVAGTCTASSTSTLTVKPDNGQLEIEFQVDQNVAGQVWNVLLADNGTRIFKGQRTTKDPSGAFTVRKLTADLAGSDTITARAKNVASGEACSASVTI
jgi:hypothetical protein